MKQVHGMHDTKTYHAWESMKARCFNLNHPSYKDYGARGISVCERWLRFENFFEDMGISPKDMSLDRIDNNKSYTPENCRWASRREQQANRRVSRLLEFNGETKVMEQWAKDYGIGSGALYNRLFQLGWSMEKALLTPLRQQKRKSEWQIPAQT